MCLPFDCSIDASVLSKMEMLFCCRFSFSLAQVTFFSVCLIDTLIALVLTSGSLWVSRKHPLLQSSASCFYSAWAADA
jgi:hypothetical protein